MHGLRGTLPRAKGAAKARGVTTRTHSVTVPRTARGERLDRFLARSLSISLERARAFVEAGEVRIRGKTCAPARKLFGGEEVQVALPAARPVAATGPSLALLHDCLLYTSPSPRDRG